MAKQAGAFPFFSKPT